MSKSKKRRVIVFICSLIIVLICFKLSIYGLYLLGVKNFDSSVLKDYRNVNEEIIVKTTAKDYIKFNDVKIKNVFEGFKKNEATADTISYSKEVDGKTKGVILSVGFNYIDVFDADKDEVTFYGSGDVSKPIVDYTDMFYVGLEDYLDDRDIEDDVDLLKYLSDYKSKTSLFSSYKKLKEDYSIRLLIDVAFPKIEKITYLEEDLRGFIFHMKEDTYSVEVIDDDKTVNFTFVGFDFDEMIDIISTVEI